MGCCGSTEQLHNDNCSLPTLARTKPNTAIPAFNSRLTDIYKQPAYNTYNVYNQSVVQVQQPQVAVARPYQSAYRLDDYVVGTWLGDEDVFAMPVPRRTKTPRPKQNTEVFTYTQHCDDCSTTTRAYVERSTPVNSTTSKECSQNHHKMAREVSGMIGMEQRRIDDVSGVSSTTTRSTQQRRNHKPYRATRPSLTQENLRQFESGPRRAKAPSRNVSLGSPPSYTSRVR